MESVLASSSKLIRKRVNDDNDEEVSEKETQLIRKRPKKTTTLVSSSPAPWTKKDEILILKGIVDYERETDLIYRSDWDAFYGRVQGLTEASFSKVELRRHVRQLKKRFTAVSEDGKGLSFADTDDHEIFSLSMKIWGKTNEVNMEHAKVDKDASSERVNESVEQTKVDLSHEEVSERMDQDLSHEEVNERMDQDVLCGEQEVSMEMNDGQKEKHTEQVSNAEARATRGKIIKSTLLSPSSPSAKMVCTRSDEVIILTGVVAYELEKELSYQDDWDSLYSFIKGSTELEFTKQQLKDKLTGLKKRFKDNMAKYEDGKGVSFISTEDDKIAKLSLLIWGEKAMDLTSLERDEQQSNGIVEQQTDLTHVEHETNNGNIVQAKDASQKRADESMNQAKTDVPNVEHGQVNEREKVAVEEICHLQDALEATLLFQTVGPPQQKSLLENLKNVEAREGKELIEEGKALAAEEMEILTKIQIKKLAYSLKFANAIPSA